MSINAAVYCLVHAHSTLFYHEDFESLYMYMSYVHCTNDIVLYNNHISTYH